MDSDKLILEIYGKVSSTETNITHLLSNHKILDNKVDSLHKRIDNQDKKIAYGLGIFAAIGFCAKMVWTWIVEKF